MNTYTAFCQNIEGTGSIWINTIEAKSVNDAIVVAQSICAHDWECDAGDVHVLGIAAGDVKIEFWEDIDG